MLNHVLTHYPRLAGLLVFAAALIPSGNDAAYALASGQDPLVMCEQYIAGDEVTIPVLGPGAAARALPVTRPAPDRLVASLIVSRTVWLPGSNWCVTCRPEAPSPSPKFHS